MRKKAYTGRRGDVLSLVPESARNVLDIGCSNGSFGGALKESRACMVTGIELDGEMAAEAREVLDHVVVGDLNDAGLYDRLPGEPFDAVVAADILEHLVDPWSVVRVLADKLTDGGVLIVSIPNVAHVSTFRALLAKKWPYRDRGIHDRTHLRFFSLRNIEYLIPGDLFRIREISRNFRIIEHPHKINKRAKYLNFWPVREFFTFQYIVVAQKK